MKRYIALYKGEATRDTQICKEDPSKVSPLDDDVWEDWPDAPVYIGLFSGMSELAAKKEAAISQGCDPACIDMVPIGDQEEFNCLLKFASMALFEGDALHGAQQLKALWTAYCFHEDLTEGSPEYTARLRAIYHQIPRSAPNCNWNGFEGFACYMGDFLVR